MEKLKTYYFKATNDESRMIESDNGAWMDVGDHQEIIEKFKRLLVLATKHCPINNNDFNEIKDLAKDLHNE